MKYLGIDWGIKRIGLAVSEGQIASPFATFSVTPLEGAVKKISEIVLQEKIDQIILGLPEGKMGEIVKKVATKLPGKVILTDETLSSQTAHRLMIEMGVKKEKRKDDNAVAAMVILQGFLESI